MRAQMWLGICAVASTGLALVTAQPSWAMSDRDATAINQTTTRALFYVGLASANLRAIKGQSDRGRAATDEPDKALVCRNAREAKPYYDEARPLATEVLRLIGPDMFGEYKANRTKMSGLIEIDDDLATLLKDCPAP